LAAIRTLTLPAPDAVSDAELVARARIGDRFSREVIYRRYARPLTGLVVRLLASRQEAEEVVQDTFLRGFGRLGSLREPAALRGWLTQIAVSLVARRLRRARLTRLLGLDRGPPETTLDTVAAAGIGADARAELALLDRTLRRLRPDVRLAWMLRHVEGMDLNEVAAACRCSLATAKRRITEADLQVERHLASPEPGKTERLEEVQP
jgi:RNA polymerase sigma-70 factor (ECF subfamily)